MKTVIILAAAAVVIIGVLVFQIGRGSLNQSAVNVSPEFPKLDKNQNEPGQAETPEQTTDASKTDEEQKKPAMTDEQEQPEITDDQYAIATFGSGCFWCTEAFFQELKGVKSVRSGYSGGETENPTYKDICTGKTGHAEVIQITYDPEVVSFAELLEVFWRTHDPTTLNRQGNDVGTQYRSAIFYHSDQQRKEAELYKRKLDDADVFASKIVTEITPFTKFYVAEKYHQNYFKDNPNQPYCRAVIFPKMFKFKKAFAEKLEPEKKEDEQRKVEN